jgi:hypothetical protein
LQTFDSFEHFKAELIEYLDYYNNRRSKAKLKGLPPALHRQQALQLRNLKMSNFLGSLHGRPAGFISFVLLKHVFFRPA